MAKAFLMQLYLLMFVIPLLSIYLFMIYQVSSYRVDFTPMGLFMDSVFYDIKNITAINSHIGRLNSTHAYLFSSSPVPMDKSLISSNIQSYRLSLEATLNSLSWPYYIDFSDLENSNTPFKINFTSGHSISYDTNDLNVRFYGNGNEEEISVDLSNYDPRGNPLIRFPFQFTTPGSVRWNVRIDDNVFPFPLTYSLNVNPNGFNRISVWYFPPLTVLRIDLRQISGRPSTTWVRETIGNGDGKVSFNYTIYEPNYIFQYLPGNFTINQSNIYKSPIGIVIGEG